MGYSVIKVQCVGTGPRGYGNIGLDLFIEHLADIKYARSVRTCVLAVCVCERAWMRACVRACVRAMCVCVCVCVVLCVCV